MVLWDIGSESIYTIIIPTFQSTQSIHIHITINMYDRYIDIYIYIYKQKKKKTIREAEKLGRKCQSYY